MLSEQEILKFIRDDKTTNRKEQAKKGVSYYEAKHDIKDYKVYYVDENGLLKEDTTKSNIKIAHPFFRELIDQCAQYMLSGNSEIVRSDITQLQTFLNEYFDDEFRMELSDLITYAKIEGFSYFYRYINEDYRTAFKFADGLNVVEVDSKYSSDGKDYIIYYYFYKHEKDYDVYKVDVWDKQGVYSFYMMNGKIEKDDKMPYKPHVIYEEDGQKFYEDLGDIPFIRMDNNKKQTSDLKVVKSLIDDYDLMSCGLSNNIQDIVEGIYVIKGYEGSDLAELTNNVRVKKLVGVGDNGDVDIKTIDIPYEARAKKLEFDEKNIYKFGMGFNSSQIGDGNVTNVVIKSRYALLDLKCNALEKQLRRFLKKIVNIVLDEINDRNNTNYSFKDVYFQFDREIITNELDNAQIEQIKANTKQIEINTLLSVATKLDDETLVQSICEVLDIDYEKIKDKLPEQDFIDLNQATKELEDDLDE